MADAMRDGPTTIEVDDIVVLILASARIGETRVWGGGNAAVVAIFAPPARAIGDCDRRGDN
jgi:hypothetical protein